MGCICSSSIAFLLLLLCFSLTPWMLFLFFLCPEVFATLVSMITCKVLSISILYIYTFNYLYLKQSFCHTLQQLYTAFSALFGSLLSFSQVVFPTPLLLKRLFLFLRSYFLSLYLASLLVCPLCLICSVIRFSLVLLTSLCLVLLSY